MNGHHTPQRQGRHPGVSAAARIGLALGVLAAAGWLCWIYAFGIAYFTETGEQRLRDMTPGIIASAVLGLVAVAVALAILRRRVLSPWLLAGLIPALIAVPAHLGTFD